MSGHGGKRTGAGRKPGKVSQAKRDIMEMAKEHAELALQTLVNICQNGEAEASRVSAANAILDRAYGRPVQGVEMSGPDGKPIQTEEVSARERVNSKLARIATRSAADGDTGEPE